MDKLRKTASRKISDKLSKIKSKSSSKSASGAHKKAAPKNNLGLYANLAYKRQTKKDAKSRERAEYLASLPKNPIKRFFWHLHPKRVVKYWFSKKGVFMALKIVGVMILVGFLSMAALYIYFQKDLQQIKPGELAKRVQTTVSKYYDRNGELLWEDKGIGDYKLVVDSADISDWAKKATVAIEDRDFYKHNGVDLWAIVRAMVNNFRGGATQGGSTLTQQLVKQVYFADESAERGLAGIPRKIKEMFLAMQVERMYNKDEIIALYLNESPYGGRRNGIESGAQTYFGKKAKDLTLPEAALLAAIPNNPAVYNPYNVDYNKSLIERQHKVLDDMQIMGYITEVQKKEAKAFDILSTIKPEQDQYANMKAPHFVQEVKKKLEEELGVKVVRAGGLTVKTTLDLRAQNAAEASVATGATTLYTSGADNIALTSVDVATGQVIAQVGSVDYNKAGYGQTNAATSALDPGSSIKPILDYAPLFAKTDVVYTPGTVLRDENIDSLYCGGNSRSCQLRNATRAFYGNVPIRFSLGNSLNIPAVKALSIVGVNEGLKTAHSLGDLSYCSNNENAGFSAAIGGGCSVRQDEHTNAYASLARGGVYKPLSYVIKVENSSGEVLKEWKDSSTRALDEQAAYMVTDILADASARTTVFGAQARSFGFVVPNVWTASKTGTTDDSRGNAKDSWMMGYSPVVATGVWSGNHDGAALSSSSNTTVRRVMNDFMKAVHENVYAKIGKWKTGDKIARPAGIQNCNINGKNDICPSWWSKNKTNSTSNEIEFDSISKKKATQCTPESTRVKITVYENTDPVTKKKTINTPEGYDASADDDVHNCSDAQPAINSVTYSSLGGNSNNYRINISIAQGKFSLKSVTVKVDGNVVSNATPNGGPLSVDYTFTKTGQTVSVEVLDEGGYATTKSYSGPAITTSSRE